ncbi:MAG: hypothetical protein H7067_11235, partial [Burkholderiales bacterium]|nr:hypothetical protein [Opitutaceae bacterium]
MPQLPSAASLRSALLRVVTLGLVLLACGGLQTTHAATPADSAAPRVLFTAASLAELQARLSTGDPRVTAHRQALEKAALVWREGVSQAPDEFHVPLFYDDR